MCCLVLLALLAGCRPAPQPLPPAPTPTLEAVQPIRLPDDDAPHNLLTEWWYYTGHLDAGSGRRYGFELVTFQVLRGQSPPYYVAHYAITDHQRHSFHFDQRARAQDRPAPGPGFDLDVDGWTMRGAGGSDHLAAAMEGYAIDLATQASKPPALHNVDGYLALGAAGGSYYYSRTRLDVAGVVEDHGERWPVRGLAWFDHQWGNFLVGIGGGWDWYSVQLDDDSELTLSVVRDEQGEVRLRYGTYVDPKGGTTHLAAGDFQAEATGAWLSPHSGARYPMGWRLRTTRPELSLTLSPVLEDQELSLGSGTTYWEGEVTVAGFTADGPIAGQGYVELTGYAR